MLAILVSYSVTSERKTCKKLMNWMPGYYLKETRCQRREGILQHLAAADFDGPGQEMHENFLDGGEACNNIASEEC